MKFHIDVYTYTCSVIASFETAMFSMATNLWKALL